MKLNGIIEPQRGDSVFTRIAHTNNNPPLQEDYMNIITVGVDISKLKFDVFYKDENGKNVSKSFENNQEGFKALTDSLSRKEIYLGMEATGNHGYALADYMYTNGHVVYVINPALIKYYGKSLHCRIKTDKQDAKLIYNFIMANKDTNLYAWKPLTKNHQEVRALNRCLLNLKDEITGFSNAHGSELSTKVKKVYKSVLKKLEAEVDSVIAQIKEIVSQDEKLKSQMTLLLTIPGIGEITAWSLLSELPDLAEFKNAKQLAVWAGVNPAIKQSGTSVSGRGSISKTGSAKLRKALYFPAIVALRFNPHVKSLGDRLKAKGKKGKVIIVAAMHKLLRIIFAMLRTGELFNSAMKV
jgi:transposase